MTKLTGGSAQPSYVPALVPLQAHITTTVNQALYQPTVPKEARFALVQAVTQNVNYVLAENSTLSATAGFRLIAGAAPTLIALSPNQVLEFYGAAAGAILELMWAK